MSEKLTTLESQPPGIYLCEHRQNGFTVYMEWDGQWLTDANETQCDPVDYTNFVRHEAKPMTTELTPEQMDQQREVECWRTIKDAINNSHDEGDYSWEQQAEIGAEWIRNRHSQAAALDAERQAAISIAATCLNAGFPGEDGSTMSAVKQMAAALAERDAEIARLHKLLADAHDAHESSKEADARSGQIVSDEAIERGIAHMDAVIAVWSEAKKQSQARGCG